MSLVNKSNCHRTENGYLQDKYGWGYQSCDCCPYGYHIDLDFVRYCETIDKQGARTDTMDKRRERRRQRQSMEVLLGVVITPNTWSNCPKLQQIPQEPYSPKQLSAVSNNNHLQSTLAQDALEDAVSDFERTLEYSNNTSTHEINNINEGIFHRMPSSVSISSMSGCMAMLGASNISRNGDFNTMNDESGSILSPKALRSIREQMALGLERMKELEEKVKMIPSLQVQISVLKDEKRKLLEQLREQSSIRIVDTVETIQKAPVQTRNASVMCNVITRTIGIGPQYPKTRTIATSTDLKSLLEEKLTNNMVNQSCQTKVNVEEAGNQTDSKVLVSLGVSVKPETKELGVQIQRESRSIGVSEDTVNKVFCSKCNVLKRSIGTGPSSFTDQHLPVSLKSLSAHRSKSFNLGEEKLNIRCRTIGCQSESFAIHKFSQYEPTKTISQQIQTDAKPLRNEGVQYENQNVTRSTDTIDLLTKRDEKCGTTPVIKLDAASNTTPVTEKPKCTRCSGENKKEENTSSVSRIPRPSNIPTTPTENRKFKRQCTYTKIAAPSSEENLSGLDLSPTTFSKIDQHIPETNALSKVKQSFNLLKITSVADQQQSTNVVNNVENKPVSSEIPLPLHEPVLYSVVDKSTREKILPSKEMQAALKVVNDSLQKSKNNNIKNQIQRALDIIQQEWFKISSTVSADPLNVEDYLDCFEEISGTLLQFVVNMTDDSGNTAMHYAVSHANFDVVSILLDSKVCNINKVNKAGYTSVMLVSLTDIQSPTHTTVVKKLFQLADVNIRARQHGQTALMLAVSHGHLEMVQMLLEAGADINIQDEDGSTSLMCAAEHGHVDIVKYFLSQPDCDSTIVDVDGSSALKIALEAGHKDLGVLLYAHEHSVRGTSPYSSLRQRKSKGSSSKSSSNMA